MSKKATKITKKPKKKRLSDYIDALGAVQYFTLVELIKVLHEAEKPEEETERDLEAWGAAVMAALPLLCKDINARVVQIIETESVLELIREAAEEAGGTLTDNSAVIASTIEDALETLPRRVEQTGKDIVRESIRRGKLGAMPAEEIIEDALEECAAKGIQSIEYANGARVSVEDYTRMAVNTDLHQSRLIAEAKDRDRRGIRTVYCAPRSEACEQCLPWLGVVMYDDVFSDGDIPDDKYPRLSEAKAAGLLHPNCKDTVRTWTPEVDATPLTAEQMDEARGAYRISQRRNTIKRNIKKYATLETATGVERYTTLRQRWEYRLSELDGD